MKRSKVVQAFCENPIITFSTRPPGVIRRQVKNLTHIIEFQYHIFTLHGKCIQISTNMPSTGLKVTGDMICFEMEKQKIGRGRKYFADFVAMLHKGLNWAEK